MKKWILGMVLLCALNAFAQDREYAKKVIRELASEEMEGRGYVHDGMTKAANYIKNELKKKGALPVNDQSTQEFYIPVNRFDGDMEVQVDVTQLHPGSDFIVSPGCPPAHGTYKLIIVDSEMVDNPAKFGRIMRKKYYNRMFLIDKHSLKNTNQKNLGFILGNGMKSKGLVFIEDKLTWSVSGIRDPFVNIYIRRAKLPSFPKEISFRIEAELINGFTCQNIIGMIKGTEKPDSYLVFTAHYDHLGRMGNETIFPGANDNAGGAAMLLDLVSYYKAAKPRCSVVFIFFAAEEAGLLGSKFFVENPLIPLKNIKFLINLDLVTTGEKGMTVVNAPGHLQAFEKLMVINKTMDYLSVINPRNNAPNSDHYPFTQKNVPAFFIYLLGDYPYYHDIYDTSDRLTLPKYDETFRLIRQFADSFM